MLSYPQPYISLYNPSTFITPPVINDQQCLPTILFSYLESLDQILAAHFKYFMFECVHALVLIIHLPREEKKGQKTLVLVQNDMTLWPHTRRSPHTQYPSTSGLHCLRTCCCCSQTLTLSLSSLSALSSVWLYKDDRGPSTLSSQAVNSASWLSMSCIDCTVSSIFPSLTLDLQRRQKRKWF